MKAELLKKSSECRLRANHLLLEVRRLLFELNDLDLIERRKIYLQIGIKNKQILSLLADAAKYDDESFLLPDEADLS